LAGYRGEIPATLRITIVTGFFLPVPPLRGGATEKTWYVLARRFAASGHGVTVVSRRWPGLADSETKDGVQYLRLPGFEHTRHILLNLMLDLIWGFRVARALPPADVVVCNTITLPVWLHRLKPAAGVVAVMIGRTPKGQVGLYGDVARIYVPSASVAAKIAQGWASARARVTGYPIDWSLLARSATQSGSPVVVGYVGRLHPEKGIDLLVRAACMLAERRDLPEWRLKLVGPASVGEGGGGDDWVKELRSRTDSALGARVEWLAPEYDAERLASVYGTLDIFCYPSIAEAGETFGVSIAEAMAARSVPVVSALNCFSDLVTDGQTGLIFDHRAPGAEGRLADCIGRLIGDSALRNDLAMRAQQHVRRFDTEEVSQAILGDLAVLTGAGTEKRE
jgi:glycosyltransferase involved in cell wall biosynthesis